MINFDNMIDNPEKLIQVERKVLWAIWLTLLAVNPKERDEWWKFAADNVENLLKTPATTTALPDDTGVRLLAACVAERGNHDK